MTDYSQFIPPIQYPGAEWMPPRAPRAPQRQPSLMEQLNAADVQANKDWNIAPTPPRTDEALYLSQGDSLLTGGPPPLQAGVASPGQMQDVNDPGAMSAAYAQALEGPGTLAAANPAEYYYSQVIAPQEQASQEFAAQQQAAKDEALTQGYGALMRENPMYAPQPVQGDSENAYADWMEVGRAEPQTPKFEDYNKVVSSYDVPASGMGRADTGGVRTQAENDKLDKEDAEKRRAAMEAFAHMMRGPQGPQQFRGDIGSGGRRY